MNETPSLEREFERRAAKDANADNLWHRYETMLQYLETEYYGWVQTACPYYTDHGKPHIQSVIQTAGYLLAPRLKGGSKSDLTTMDLFLLLAAIIWHDVGMVYGRSGHADRVLTLMESIRTLAFPCPTTQRLVNEIVRAHAGDRGLCVPKPDEDCAMGSITYQVYPRALAAVLKLADEVSENRSRISLALLPSVPEAQQIFWQYTRTVVSARPEPERERIVMTIELDTDAVLRRFPCKEINGRCDGEGKISVLEYVLCRLEKMNNERIYCGTSLARYASIREIEARLTLVRGAERLADYDTLTLPIGDCGLDHTSYPGVGLFLPFFDRHPRWRPETLAEAMKP
jgi:hypothetical protein